MRYFLLFLFLLPVVSAQATFFKESYSFGETVQLEIEFEVDIVGDLESTQASVLKPSGEELRVPISLLKIEEDYYFAFFDLPGNVEAGTYSFQINGIRYREGGQLRFMDVREDFEVVLGDYDVIRILPGAVVHREGERSFFKIRVSNLEESAVSFELPSSSTLTPTVNLLQIPGRSIKNFYILVNPANIVNSGIELFEFGDYVIPFYLMKTSCTSDWECSGWGNCINGVEIRSCSDVNNCGKECDSELCSEERECEICNPDWECVGYGGCRNDKRECDLVLDVNECGESYFGDYSEFSFIDCGVCVSDWECSGWGECVNNVERRTCVDGNYCGEDCESELCVEERVCEVCDPDWECVGYGECSGDKRECDLVLDVNECGESYFGDYSEFSFIDCGVCVPGWRCGKWGRCVNGVEIRSCSDVNNCGEECDSELCSEERECARMGYSIVFFKDPNRPEVTVNSLVNPELNEKQDLSGALYIKNTGDYELTNIRFRLTGNLNGIVKISISRADRLGVGEIMLQTLTVNEYKYPGEDEYQGKLIFLSDQLNESFSMIFVISREDTSQGIPKRRERETLFSEEIAPLSDEEIAFPFAETEKEEEPKFVAKKEPPYKVIVSILVIILIIMVYFIIKKSTKRDVSFKEYVSKIEKK
ncbi:MAG: hypothetical protein ABIB47_04090 [Candidatus Woesearchaeota archaeon]